MNILEAIITGVAVATDAFAVATCKGLSIKKLSIKKIIIIGLWLGIFQSLMPYMGFKLGSVFKDAINVIDNYIAFILLMIIGLNMIYESNETQSLKEDISLKEMFPLALATSIDAMAVGIAYQCAYKSINYLQTFIIMGIITFILSSIGVVIGYKIGDKLKKKSQIIGGLIIIIIAIKIMLTS